MSQPLVDPSAARLLHAMIRVKDLDRSVAFYRDGLGMRLQRRLDFQDARFTLLYLGYEDDRASSALELTWNWDEGPEYTHGTGYGHIGVGVADLDRACRDAVAAGGKVTRPPGEMMSSGIHIAFVEDPDGYKIELIALPFPKPWMKEANSL